MLPSLISELEARAGDFLTACEGMSRNAMATALACVPGLRNPFAPGPIPNYALLVELTSTIPVGGAVDLSEVLIEALGPCLEGPDATAADVLIGRGEEFWALRHSISESLKRVGRVVAFDLSVPRSTLPRLRAELSTEIEARFPNFRICDFGHSGDGGDHFNLVWPNDIPHGVDEAAVTAIRDLIYDKVVLGYGGSFSAEHGVGPYNAQFYRRYVPKAQRTVAAGLKRLFDPTGLLGHLDYS